MSIPESWDRLVLSEVDARKCGHFVCRGVATTVYVLTGDHSIIFRCCDACREYFGPDRIPAAIRVEAIDEEKALALQVMEDVEVRNVWVPSLGCPA